MIPVHISKGEPVLPGYDSLFLLGSNEFTVSTPVNAARVTWLPEQESFDVIIPDYLIPVPKGAFQDRGGYP
jgi:hypothetical protein